MKEIKKFPGYFVNEAGEVFSSFCKWGKRKNLFKLSGTKNLHGYWKVGLRKNGKSYVVSVHKLVLETFVGEPGGRQACHLDGNQDNNQLENLKWGTAKDNALDKIAHGRSCKYEANAASKLKIHQISRIKWLLSSGVPQRQIASTFHVSQRTICNINRGFSWVGV